MVDEEQLVGRGGGEAGAESRERGAAKAATVQ
jgi:hypothetical protein